MKLLGYSDRWSVSPGDEIRFMVSTEAASFDLAIVRLFQVDDRAEAPPWRVQQIDAACAGTYPGTRRSLNPGSYLRVRGATLPATGASFSFACWVLPTGEARGRRGLFARRASRDAPGIDLLLDATRHLLLECGDARGVTSVVRGPQLEPHRWHCLVAGYDAASGQARLWCRARDPHFASVRFDAAAVAAPLAVPGASGADLLLGALHDGAAAGAVFNGKLAHPALFDRLLDDAEIAAFESGAPLPADGLVADWDFGALPFGLSVPDRSGNGHDAMLVNAPLRAVTGPHWTGLVTDFRQAPSHYAAIRLHDDDLDDAGWPADATWRLPDDLPGGVYAARLRAGDAEDHLPFFVAPRRASARVLLVFPTFTYLAYANERFHAMPLVDWQDSCELPLHLSPQDRCSADNPALGPSIYDLHGDGSACCRSSLLRPVVNFRPGLRSYWNGGGRHFVADMYLVDWLDRIGVAHDVATDHDLHARGLGLLAQYDVVLLGSHPEYMSRAMRDALDGFVAGGGRLLYLGGNGGWWVTAVDPLRPHAIEVRKAFHNSAIAGLGVGPGEERLAATGEPGGSWRAAGRPPEALFGVGFAGQGFCRAQPYRRRPGSFDPRVAPFFDGIGADEVIGDFGLALGGAAGDEFDRAFPENGTPPGLLILASSSGHATRWCQPIASIAHQKPGPQGETLRSDVTWYELPGGGAVFAAGSMCWCTSLAFNLYDNNVARLTGNVLRAFLDGAGCR